MFDIHCHILHGVDDGSGNLSDSLEMAKLAADSGTKAIIATPHCNIPATFDNYWSKDIETKFSALRQAVREYSTRLNQRFRAVCESISSNWRVLRLVYTLKY